MKSFLAGRLGQLTAAVGCVALVRSDARHRQVGSPAQGVALGGGVKFTCRFWTRLIQRGPKPAGKFIFIDFDRSGHCSALGEGKRQGGLGLGSWLGTDPCPVKF